jgi:hypothetical protein
MVELQAQDFVFVDLLYTQVVARLRNHTKRDLVNN